LCRESGKLKILDACDRLISTPRRIPQMYAVVQIAGRQYKVKQNDTIRVPSLDEKEGTNVRFDQILLVGSEKQITVGHPLVRGANVEATVLGNGKADKVMILKKKKRKGYRLKHGHRQPYTEVKITNIAI
jgi:large subunit ribosomal protein L21